MNIEKTTEFSWKPSDNIDSKNKSLREFTYSINDSFIMGNIATTAIETIKKKVHDIIESINGSGKSTEKSDSSSVAPDDNKLKVLPEENYDTKKLKHPEIMDKIIILKRAGFTFYLSRYKEEDKKASDIDVYKRYAHEEKVDYGINAMIGDKKISMPYTDEGLDLLQYFYLNDDSVQLKNPEIATAIKKLQKSPKQFHEAFRDSANKPAVFSEVENPVHSYVMASEIKRKSDYNSRLYWKDGDDFESTGATSDPGWENSENFIKIESNKDFIRACVIGGIEDKEKLSKDEQEALPMIYEMLDKGYVFKSGIYPKKAGPMKMAASVGDHNPQVTYTDEKGRQNGISSLEDLMHIYCYYYKKDMQDLPPKDVMLLNQAKLLLDNNLSFTSKYNYNTGIRYGAPMIVKATYGKTGIPESPCFMDDRERLAELNRPEDLERIEELYVKNDISGLPDEEQKIIKSLQELFSKENSSWSTKANIISFLKGILGETDTSSLTISDYASKEPVYVNIRLQKDIDRFLAIYVDKDLGRLPNDEKEALQNIKALRSAGIKFEADVNNVPYYDQTILQILKSEDKHSTAIYVKSNLPAPENKARIDNLSDLKRLRALWVENDTSLLPKDEKYIVDRLKELRKKGLKFSATFCDSDINIIKGFKGEKGEAWLRHKSGNGSSKIDEPDDFDRIDALYANGDFTRLSQKEQDIIGTITFMQNNGYNCAVAYRDRIDHAEPFDVLKSVLKNYNNIGFTDRNSAFTEVSSIQDLNDLKAIHQSTGLDAYNFQELKLINLIQNLMRKGYIFQAGFRLLADNMKDDPSGRYYPIGPLMVYKALKAGTKDIWLVKDKERIPISKFLDVVDMYDIIAKNNEEDVKDVEDSIIEDDEYIIVGGIRIPVKKGA